MRNSCLVLLIKPEIFFDYYLFQWSDIVFGNRLFWGTGYCWYMNSIYRMPQVWNFFYGYAVIVLICCIFDKFKIFAIASVKWLFSALFKVVWKWLRYCFWALRGSINCFLRSKVQLILKTKVTSLMNTSFLDFFFQLRIVIN